MSVINTNVSATIAQNALVKNSRQMQTAMQQLSTGSRINSAKDDAAGLAISSKMTAQINGLNQAVRNANDGISLIQTAEGALVEVTNMLQRMRELAVQSATDSNTADDRAYLDLEYQQLTQEIARIAENTESNGMNILNNTEVGVAGTATDVGTGVRNVQFQVGANADQVISIGLKDFSFGTGTPAVASESQLNLSAKDLSGAKNFTLDIGATTFSVSIGTAIAGAATTSAETTALTNALKAEINNTVGFEDVSISAVGTTISIVDSKGRGISDFTAAEADATDVTTTDVQTVSAAGSVASGAAAPDATAVFSGVARLNDTNIETRDDANVAIARLDNAIKAVNEERATMGAVMNRLTFAADNLMNVSQNASEARSRVLDTDFAQTTTDLARTQIIAQAGTAMLAQANQQPQSVLALLQ